MKKPTFSKPIHWILSLFESLFHIEEFYCASTRREFRNWSKPVFQRSTFSTIQYRAIFLLFFFFLITTLSSFSNLGISASSRIGIINVNAKKDVVLIDSLKSKFAGTTKEAAVFNVAITNPVIKYAQLPYAGQVSICPNDGKELPKLFLCGGNDSRLIETGITDAQSITWERFISGGSCITVSNSDCANESAAASCWAQIATGKDYLANSAGQFRVKITDSAGTPYVFYFNVYQNNLVPTAVAKNDIVKYGASCKIDGKITVGGFGSGYEYSFTTGSTPGTWQDSNVFTTSTPGTYTAFIRIKGIVGSCEFKVINLEIKSLDFAVTTSITSPKCNGGLGSVQVITNDVKQQYIYKIFNSANVLVSSSGTTANPDYTFTGLSSGTYKVETSVVGSSCMVDTKTNVIVANAPTSLTSTASITTALTPCNTGAITITAAGGTSPYKYYVDIDGAGFVENPTKVIIVSKSGNYVIRVEDVNGCSASNTTVIVPVVDKPVYTISKVDGNCTGSLGQISINVTDTKGYTMGYSIDNGTNYYTTSVFSSLTPGIYSVKVRYKKSGSTCYDPAVTITIGASTALTASAGVAELSGCGPVGNELQGKVRITNPQGGTTYPAPNLYRYSFDNKATWITSNEAFISPGGPYTFYIKDAAGCEYAMGGIVLDPKPAAPTISVNEPVFNCDGSATSTVTVTNSGSGDPKFSYDYYIDGVLNTSTPSNIFKNVTQGDHTITVNYNVLSVSTYSNLLQEDFGKGGFTTTPGINPAYCFEDEATTHLLPGYTCNTDQWINDGEYAVASSIVTTFGGTWLVANDHTLPDDPKGRFLCVNVGGTAGIGGILYSKPIKDVIPNQPVIISLWAENLIKSTKTSYDDPKLTIQLVNNLNGVGGTETIVATTPVATPWVVPKSDKWEYKELSLNPGAYTNLSFVIRSYNNEFNGNDVLIDDIWVRQIPKSCNTMASFPVIVDGSKAFSASITGYKDVKCNGQQNGEITLSAKNFNLPYGFDYSMDNGVTWVNSKVSPVTVTGLTNKIYNIKIRFDASTGSCSFPFSQEIKMPSALTVSASVTKVATCKTGATITAVAKGGTSPYEYELRQSNGTTVVKPFSSNGGVFTDVPTGNYMIFVLDANLCTTSVGATVSVTAATPPVASLDATTDWCYTTANPATLVVNASSGVGPYTYALDGNAPVNSNTFSNVAPGTHTIIVTDTNLCTATISNISIAPQLQLNATLAQDLTCLVNASITATVVDGYGAPYTYTVSRNGGASTVVSSFPYAATLSGTYVFTVTDSKSCPATSNAITVTPKTTPTLTSAKTDITCNNANDGTITVTAANGFTTTYTYAIKLSAAATYTTQTTNQFTGLAAGTYNIKVIDSKGCESAVSNVTIVNPTVVGGTISATELACSSTGAIPAVVTVNGSGGTGSYEYSFNGATSFSSDNTYSTYSSGTVTAYIKDKNGCQFGPLSIIINPKVFITGIDVFFETGLECPAYEAHVKFQAVGGLSPIRYQIISGPSGFSSAVVSDGEFKNLKPGDYIFRATDKNGCSFERPYHVSDVPDIVAGGSVLTPIKCFGDKGTIQFTVNGVKDRGYDYVIKNAANVIIQTASNVSETVTIINVTSPQPAGVYTITATDRKTTCPATYSITLTQPSAALSITSATATNVNCNNDNSQITVVASNGTPNYTYAFAKSPSTVPTSTYGTNPLTVDTNSGVDLVWDVYVKDANDCTIKKTVTVISDAMPAITSVVVGGQCTASGSGFTITATPSATSLAPLTYGIAGPSGAFQTSPIFTVSAGTYTVYIKDKNGCIVAAPASTTVYPELIAGSSVTKTLDCSASPNAVITVTIAGGKSPFTYTVKKGSGAASAASSPSAALSFTYSVSNANADAYTFVITDANGCTSTTSTTVNPITNPTATPTPTQVSCNGGVDGTVSLAGSGGSGGYTYSFNGSAFTGTTSYSGLSAGIAYPYQVKDSKGCVSTAATITLTQPATLAATVTEVPFSCNTSNAKVAGTVTINAPSGGTGPFEYSFNGSGYGSINVLTLNDNGANQPYTYSVRDSKLCTVSGSGTLLKLNPPTDLAFANAVITCTATSTTVTVTATNGVGTLQYETITPSPIIRGKQTSNSFASLTAGTYLFKVTDANGCYYTESYEIKDVVPIAISGNVDTNVKCNGDSTAKATFTVSGNATVGAYTFALTAGTLGTGTLTQSGNTLTLANVKSGTYTVRVTDTATGCFKDGTVVITQPSAALSITSATATNVNCNNDNSQITVVASNGTPNYTYAFAK
ncbi:SprB repeat-containing protein, partial [Flavobacterium taihuense]